MSRKRSRVIFALGLACLLAATGAAAEGIASVVIDGSQASATISLPGGIGAGLHLGFGQAVGLTETNLGLSAELVNPQDPDLHARLPGGGVGIPAVFPMLLTIEPPATGGLSFSGVATLELHTHNLGFQGNSPLRLFAAPAGGPFEDVTASMGLGSYRVRCDRGDFSEFLIAIDLRSKESVARGKFAALRARLEDYQPLIEPGVFAQLEGLLESAEAAYDASQYVEAADLVESFSAAVQAASGGAIPDVWRSARDLVNVAGILRGAAGTLRFSIQRQNRRGSPP
jgi:hypothetical protein